MDKIMRYALQAAFPGLNIDTLQEIISVTPNPTVAAEMLLGLYEPPVIEPNSHYFFPNKYQSQKAYELIGKDELRNTADVLVYTPITETFYALTREDREAKRYVSKQELSSKDWYTSAEFISGDGCHTELQTIRLEDLDEFKPISPEDMGNWVDQSYVDQRPVATETI